MTPCARQVSFQEKNRCSEARAGAQGEGFDAMRPVLPGAGAGALRARRVLRQLINDEQQALQPVAAHA